MASSVHSCEGQRPIEASEKAAQLSIVQHPGLPEVLAPWQQLGAGDVPHPLLGANRCTDLSMVGRCMGGWVDGWAHGVGAWMGRWWSGDMEGASKTILTGNECVCNCVCVCVCVCMYVYVCMYVCGELNR